MVSSAYWQLFTLCEFLRIIDSKCRLELLYSPMVVPVTFFFVHFFSNSFPLNFTRLVPREIWSCSLTEETKNSGESLESIIVMRLNQSENTAHVVLAQVSRVRRVTRRMRSAMMNRPNSLIECLKSI